ncbi:B12-binding domain-containing radical SAM protein [Patescibacteria group bacterium]|nr:B12-binding domain-containing radical SAM protein [Patescibacteria group bacterium]
MKTNFKILFLYPNLRSESLVPPSITLLSRILKNNGFITDLFDSTIYEIDSERDADRIRERFLATRISDHILDNKKDNLFRDLNSKVNEFSPDLIAISATESTFLVGIELLKGIKEVKPPVIVGGVFATFAPQKALRFKEVDMVCVGEGEETLLELCEKMSLGKNYTNIPGLWAKDKKGNIVRNPMRKPVNIDRNPTNFDIGLFSEQRLYRPMGGRLYRMLPVETHRGCPYGCRYCNSPAQNKLHLKETGDSFFRKKSNKKIQEEIIHYRNKWNVEYFFFWADTFLAMPSKEFDEFCEMYSDIKIPFYVQTRPETVSKKRLARLKEVGMKRIGFGVEHGNEEFRKKILNRHYPNNKIISKLKIVSDLGITFSTSNMIGLPKETPQLAMDTIELNRQIYSDTTSSSIFMPFHGTLLRELSEKENFINPEVICPSNNDESILTMPQFPAEKIKGIRRTFSMYIKFPKNRWPEIKLAEQFTPEGNAVWEKLRKEFLETFFGKKPESDF